MVKQPHHALRSVQQEGRAISKTEVFTTEAVNGPGGLIDDNDEAFTSGKVVW
jgi:hypothetical protein